MLSSIHLMSQFDIENFPFAPRLCARFFARMLKAAQSDRGNLKEHTRKGVDYELQMKRDLRRLECRSEMRQPERERD
jgi:hypothetical protein